MVIQVYFQSSRFFRITKVAALKAQGFKPNTETSKKYLAQYVAIFENAFNFKEQLDDVISAMIVPDYFLENYTSP